MTQTDILAVDGDQTAAAEVQAADDLARVEALASMTENAVIRLDQRVADLELGETGAMGAAMSGLMELRLEPVESTIPAAELNAGAAGTVTREFEIAFRVPGSREDLHEWLSGLEPVLTAAEAAADAQIGVPTIDGTPAFISGLCTVRAVLDTDAGATKTYIVGTPAAGDITAIVGANHVDGEILPLIDALGSTQTLEFDDDGSVAAGNILVDITGTPDAPTMASRIAAAVNGILGFGMTATPTAAVVDFVQNIPGTAGNTTIDVTGIADAGFLKTDFAGGVDADSVSVLIQISAKAGVAANTWLHLGFDIPEITKVFTVV